MRKFRDFSVTQILREMNLGESRASINAVFAILGVLNLVILVNFISQKVENVINMPKKSFGNLRPVSNFLLSVV